LGKGGGFSGLAVWGCQMEMMYTLAEAVLISFFMGAIMGGVVAAHLKTKHQVVELDEKKESPRPG